MRSVLRGTLVAACTLAAACECGYPIDDLGPFTDTGSSGTTFGPPPWTSGGTSDGGMPTGSGTTGAAAGPRFAFVLHADPAIGPSLEQRWGRLVAFMDDLAARNANRPVPHHVTIMMTPNWGYLVAADPAKQTLVAGWVAAGHEIAFHSHTHNHARRDGYTNAADLFGPDDWSLCMGDPDAGECTLDTGLAAVEAGLEAALGRPYDIRFATIGPQGNEGPGPMAMNNCPPGQDPPVADEHGCIDGEWTGAVEARVEYQATAYPGVTEADTADPSSLLGSSFCDRFGDASEDVYSLPIAPFETESGALAVTLDTVSAAFAMAAPDDFIGVVIHPYSYVDGPSSTFDGNARDQVLALFDAADAAGIVSRTLGEIHDGDDVGGGVACRDLR